MKLSVKAAAFAGAIMTAGTVLLTGICNLAFPPYGDAFLRVMASIYPGFQAAGSFGDVIIGTLYALVDGAVGGLILAWLYNMCVPKSAA